MYTFQHQPACKINHIAKFNVPLNKRCLIKSHKSKLFLAIVQIIYLLHTQFELLSDHKTVDMASSPSTNAKIIKSGIYFNFLILSRTLIKKCQERGFFVCNN